MSDAVQVGEFYLACCPQCELVVFTSRNQSWAQAVQDALDAREEPCPGVH